MTDKQIIIDGVDITNCIHRATNKLCGDIDAYCRCYTGSCKDISNCYYKQLKRKEQECERSKINNAQFIKDNQFLSERNSKLKAENEHLTEKEEEARRYLKEAYKLNQTLAEIRDVAENREIFCENCSGGCDEFTCDDCGYVKILQKISEVEDDR